MSFSIGPIVSVSVTPEYSRDRAVNMLQESFLFGAEQAVTSTLPGLVILSNLSDTASSEFQQTMMSWLASGAVMIVSAGRGAVAVEDAIDWIIEDAGKLEVVTTAHPEETPQEVLDFAFSYMKRNFESFRVVLISAEESASHDEWRGLLES